MLSQLTRMALRRASNASKYNSKGHNYKQLFTKAELDGFLAQPHTIKANRTSSDVYFYGAVPAVCLFLWSGGIVAGYGIDRIFGVDYHIHDGMRAAENGKW